VTDIRVFSEIEKRGHEQVAFFHYPELGLKTIISIHTTQLGPALGGCRMRLYQDEILALDDVLRLSEGMTYKSSLAGLDLGGGKAVIIADPALKVNRAEIFKKFGECLNALNGRYLTAEDMGTSVEDIMNVRSVSPHAAGLAVSLGGGGDPSPWTARGVFMSIVAACERKFDSKELAGIGVAVQGVGNVGSALVELLVAAGANVTITDTVTARLTDAKAKLKVQTVGPDEIYDVPCDVFAPCAAGQTINKETLKRLSCSIIAGAANNQLQDAAVYCLITQRKMLYCPDFVVNAGGVINVAAELVPGGYKKEWVTAKVDAIYHTIHRILDEADLRDQFPEVVAIDLAKERLKNPSLRFS